ncbi:hypothetical protein [Vitiosangium sp. GDMCC 1.1324]|uniref:hypothetical protein n=1 Tax=Vitiosangium sp. (strain GDMCC 1.1324) TaxID=2138576 RepID=UPI000D37D83E|nr:hypothetical protein [Vitiosangium sp. GDMCC 1.1324]PTL82226.1 hypothetical protein DAT35_20775 [Vitiosangium sp. GDMCC 1.1324]
MLRPHLLSLVMLFLVARPAVAETSAQFRIDPLAKVKIEGLSAKDTATFYAGVDAFTNHLASFPSVNTPTPPVCVALQREVFRVPMTPNQAQGKVNISYLAPMSRQTCRTAKIVNSSVEMNLNLAPFVDQNNAIGQDDAGWLLVPQTYTKVDDGVFLVQLRKHRYYVITRDREAALVPVTLERYLKFEERKVQQRVEEVDKSEQRHREWLARMHENFGPDLKKAPADLRDTYAKSIQEAEKNNQESRAKVSADLQQVRGRLASLSPEQRAQPACMESLKGGMATNVVAGPCKAPSLGLFAFNPELSKPGADKGTVRYLVVDVLDMRHSTEEEHNFNHRTQLMEHFDFAALARVLRSTGK